MSELRLYEYPRAIAEARARDEAIRAEDPDCQQAPYEEIDRLEGGRDEKIEHVAMHVQTKEAEAGVYKEKADEFNRKARAATRDAEWYRRYLHKGLLAAGKQKIKGRLLTVGLRKCPISCKIVQESRVPEEWIIKTVTEVPDKVKIIKAFKADGHVVDGCEIINDKTTVVIR